MATAVAFAVGMNNFGAGKVATSDIVSAVRRAAAGVRVVSFGSTGNLAVIGAPADLDLPTTLLRCSGLAWFVGDQTLIEAGLTAVEGWDPGPDSEHNRWTAGISFAIELPQSTTVHSTTRVQLRSFDDGRVVLAQKLDALDPSGRLDKHHRRGGWGGVSADIQQQIGGRWTSRSARTVKGLLDRC